MKTAQVYGALRDAKVVLSSVGVTIGHYLPDIARAKAQRIANNRGIAVSGWQDGKCVFVCQPE